MNVITFTFIAIALVCKVLTFIVIQKSKIRVNKTSILADNVRMQARNNMRTKERFSHIKL